MEPWQRRLAYRLTRAVWELVLGPASSELLSQFLIGKLVKLRHESFASVIFAYNSCHLSKVRFVPEPSARS
jgi:hypothetical protein